MSEKPGNTSSNNVTSKAKPGPKPKSPPVKAETVEPPQSTQAPQEGFTPQEEALYRLQEGVAAPTIADIEDAENPAAAQDVATTALLMGDQPPPLEDAETVGEFRARYIENTQGIEGFQGITREDMVQRQNMEVAMISAENPPQELREQRAEGYSHLPQPVAPDFRRSLSLEELGRRKIELGNPGMFVPFDQRPVAEPRAEKRA